MVTFVTAVAASAEAASAAAAVTRAWSDRDLLDQDCSATMKVDYPKLDNILAGMLRAIFETDCGLPESTQRFEASAMRCMVLSQMAV